MKAHIDKASAAAAGRCCPAVVIRTKPVHGLGWRVVGIGCGFWGRKQSSQPLFTGISQSSYLLCTIKTLRPLWADAESEINVFLFCHHPIAAIGFHNIGVRPVFSCIRSIYFHLEDKFEIARSEIPRRLADFADGLEKIFGAGAQFLEILIMKKLYERIKNPLGWDESEEFVFVEYVAAARSSFLNGQKRS